jgi:predicted nucleotidyltransferase
MSNFEKILHSFSIKETLNPKVWENSEDPKKAMMIPKVRKALERIAVEFIDDLGEDVFVEDVYLMGSLANFNWSEYSDFDLHVIVDFEKYENQEDLYKELFDLKKKLFNDKHNIKIFGYDVEVYAQGISDESHSDGVYSVMNNEWIHKPKRTSKDLDMSVLKTKIKSWTDKIDDAIEDAKSEGNVETLKKLKDKLKDYRQSGLDKDGEFSYENLVFKYLRRSGHIGKLFDEKTKIKDKELSVERTIQEYSNNSH